MRALTFLVLLFCYRIVAAEPLHIVAAENIYGSVAQQIGGPHVTVYNILNNPAQDPHLFSSSHTTAKAITTADIVIANGIGYDTWIERLLSSSRKPPQVIVVAQLLNKKMGDNPHLWYDPITMPIYAKALTELLIKLDASHRDYYTAQLRQFELDYRGLTTMINKIKQRHQRTPVIATEPVFNYMSDALGLQMHGQGFQINIMNDAEPSPTQVKSFEDDLRNHQVKVLIYNNQVNNPRTQYMQRIAQQSNIPVVGMSEMLPPQKTYLQWMQNALLQLEQALSAQH